MPELPEVETVRRSLARELAGRTIVGVRSIGWPATIAAPSPAELCDALCDRRIEGVDRRAKYIFIRLDRGETLVVHLRMTGQMLVVAADSPADKHTHVVLSLDDGRELRFHDTRKFGRWWLLDGLGLAELDAKLGPEPLAENFDRTSFATRLRGRRTKIKPTLLDQSLIVGIGNIYADEALWTAQIHPLRGADSLGEGEVARLLDAIVAVLTHAIARRGTTLVNYRDATGAEGENQHHLSAYGRTGKPCPRCGAPIERIVVGQRSTHFCPHCQTC